MKVYIVKYALTRGIQVREAKLMSEYPSMVRVEPDPGEQFASYYHGNEWTDDPDKAFALAEWMRDKKLKSLQKQIDRILKLKFTIPEEPPRVLAWSELPDGPPSYSEQHWKEPLKEDLSETLRRYGPLPSEQGRRSHDGASTGKEARSGEDAEVGETQAEAQSD